MMTLAALCELLEGHLEGEDRFFSSVSTDTRTLKDGELFIALRGERFDGHDHCRAARDQGACALLVERHVEVDLPQIIVADARKALGLLGQYWRLQCAPRTVTITGSNGKTTVKETLAAILSQVGRVLATQGNLNNDIGVPLTLFRLTAEDEYAVIETGANHAGEIDWLTRIAVPDVALVTNAGDAHLEGFGSLEGIARAKGECFLALSADGTAVINRDDRFFPLWEEFSGARRRVTFGRHQAADVRLEDRQGRHWIVTADWEAELQFALLGEHNRLNALAATAVAYALGVSREAILAGLAGIEAVKGRLQTLEPIQGARIIDDSYNANPTSFKAAIDVLAAYGGKRLLIMGDMKELGAEAASLHKAIGVKARESGLDGLYALGEFSRAAVEAFGNGARHFDNHNDLARALLPELGAEVTVLLKGSRASRMEQVVSALCGEVACAG